MAGYSSTPLWKKLGYKDGIDAYVEGAPPDYRAALQLPLAVKVCWRSEPADGVTFVHIFCREAATLRRELVTLRKRIAPAGAIWVSWPKKASGVPTDITENTVRDCALPLGFVDIKVCAVDETWSGLKLVVRRSER